MAIETVGEEWRPIPGRSGYFASNHGRIKGPSKRPATFGSIARLGYRRFHFSDRRVYVHRLVMMAFVGNAPPDKPEVNHIDNNPGNNRLSNLEYVSRSGNMVHAVKTRGSSSWARKLTDENVREIRRLVASGLSQSEVGRRFGIASPNINHIVHRKQWKHVA